MARDWEAQFREWAKPPGQMEQERCHPCAKFVLKSFQKHRTC